MRANVRKSWNSLLKSEQEEILEYAKEVAKEVAKEIAYEAATEQLNCDLRIMIDIYIKMVCMVLHDGFHFDESELTMFLGSHRRSFAKLKKLQSKDKQLEYLDKRMSEIFSKDGFPQGFFDEFLGSYEEKG